MKPNQGKAASRRALAALCLGLCLGGGSGSPAAEEPAEVELRLQAIRARIAALETELARDAGERDQLNRELQTIETEIGRLGRELRRLDAEMARQRRELEALDEREQKLIATLERQRELLAGQLRTAYALGRRPVLKLLLNLDDARAVGRTLTYFRYYHEARAREIAALREGLAELAAVRASQAGTSARLSATRAELAVDERRQGEQRERRRQLLERLTARMTGTERELEELGRDRERLEQLLEELTQLFADLPAGADATPFSRQRGALRWPLAGRTLLGPGQAKPGGMSPLGMLLGAPRGTEVKAVSYGRVAYADWLRGFGLLAIVDHGEGFMSLYAFNESLFAEIGDWVGAGQTIAAVGDSGGRAEPALYFELRHQGRPVDPTPWFTPE